jgi:nucleotide-binding universal stress UspA family protein
MRTTLPTAGDGMSSQKVANTVIRDVDRRIVVGVDGTQPGWLALAWSVDQVATAGGHLVICYVAPPRSALHAAGGTPTLAALELADPALARAVAGARLRLGGQRVRVGLRFGDPDTELLAAGQEAHLLVVGAPMSRLGARSTARRVAARAGGPVVVVRPVTGPAGPFAGHVVVGVDERGDCAPALAFAFAFAERHRVPLVAAHATGWTGAVEGDVWLDETFGETHLAPVPAALQLLDAATEGLRYDHPSVRVKHALLHGGAVGALQRAARGSRLLVVGDRGRDRAARMLLGSVSQGLVSLMTGPVAVVHAGQG